MITVLVLMTFYDENGLHKAGSITQVKEEDFNPQYMKKITPPSPGGSTELSELDDVDISGVEDGEILKYDAATEKWINATGGGGSGSVITNIYTDGEGHVESMEIDGTEYEFGTGETTIDESAIDTDSNGKVKLMDINGNNYEFTSIENVSTDDNSKVESMDIDGTNYEFTSVENVSIDSNGKVESMEINGTSYDFATGTGDVTFSTVTPTIKNKVGSIDAEMGNVQATLEFASLLEDLEDVDVTGVADGEVLTYDNGVWTYSTPTKIENISETGGVVDSMDIDGATYNFATGGGGGGSSLVVTLTGAYVGATIDLTSMNQGVSVQLSADKTYAEMKAADEIIFKIVETTTSRTADKYTLKPTGMYTSTATGDQSLFYTFSVITPSLSTPKVFRLEVSPWSNTLVCVS